MRDGQLKAGPLQPSGRVIAGGRLLLSCLFLIAIWADASQSARTSSATYTLLASYAAWSLAVTLLVWNDWWQNARLAAPAHVIDVAVFMIILYSTEGYSSPYFIFFIFILLSAAIRWGWRETAITAGAVIAVYFTVGLLLGPSAQVEVDRFIVRTGHLVIISAILIWFGANQWVAWPRLGAADDPAIPLKGDAYVAALRSAMAAIGASRGILLWKEAGEEEVSLVRASPESFSRSRAAKGMALPQLGGSLLFDLARDRALMRADASRWRFLRAAVLLPPGLRNQLERDEGLAIPIVTGSAEGIAIFHDVRALSTDHLDSAPRLARDIAVRLQDAALFEAVEERSMAKARVAVARDLHDSVVQFLAGLGFRLEALKRSAPAEGELGETLAELKDSVMTEQRQLRAFIRGLGTGKPIAFEDLSRDCASLCELLGRQWDIECTYTGESGSGAVPVRTQLDVQQLVREAVANAVRHGGARHVTVSLGGEGGELRLTVADDGKGFAAAMADSQAPAPVPPASLSGRVREAQGVLEVSSAAGETRLSIRLPVEAAA